MKDLHAKLTAMCGGKEVACRRCFFEGFYIYLICGSFGGPPLMVLVGSLFCVPSGVCNDVDWGAV